MCYTLSVSTNDSVLSSNISNKYLRKEENCYENIKEIFNLHNQDRYLERIPKLGIIQKTLRVADQHRLLNCVKEDLEEVSLDYFQYFIFHSAGNSHKCLQPQKSSRSADG